MLKKTTIVSSAAMAVIGAAALLTPASPAAAASIQPRGVCHDTFDPTTDGGQASWTLFCSDDGRMRIIGWVKDIRADGQCAYVNATANDGERMPTAKACPKGTITNFDWRTASQASSITAYLTVS